MSKTNPTLPAPSRGQQSIPYLILATDNSIPKAANATAAKQRTSIQRGEDLEEDLIGEEQYCCGFHSVMLCWSIGGGIRGNRNYGIILEEGSIGWKEISISYRQMRAGEEGEIGSQTTTTALLLPSLPFSSLFYCHQEYSIYLYVSMSSYR